MKKKKTYLNPPDWLAEAFKTGNKEQMAQLLIDVNFDKAGWNKFRYKCVGPDPNDVYIYMVYQCIYTFQNLHIYQDLIHIYTCVFIALYLPTFGFIIRNKQSRLNMYIGEVPSKYGSGCEEEKEYSPHC